MKILVLFSGWADESNKDFDKWKNLYRSILIDDLRSCDKILAFTSGCSLSFANAIHDAPNVISSELCAPELEVNSDATGYQSCLQRICGKIDDYDIVLFLHSKGVSHSFEDLSPLIERCRYNIISPNYLSSLYSKHKNGIFARETILAQERTSISQVSRLTEKMGIINTPPCFLATSTIYAISANILKRILGAIPSSILWSNLVSDGYNKYFFESVFPCLALSFGADFVPTEGSGIMPSLSPYINYSMYPAHNNAITLLEIEKARREGPSYSQKPTPYVVASSAALEQIYIAYEA